MRSNSDKFDQQGGGDNVLQRKLTNFFRSKVDEVGKEQMNPDKVGSLKMLLFDIIPWRCKRALTGNKHGPFSRTTNYRYFDKGLKDFENEINIVEVLRELRFYKVAV